MFVCSYILSVAYLQVYFDFNIRKKLVILQPPNLDPDLVCENRNVPRALKQNEDSVL